MCFNRLLNIKKQINNCLTAQLTTRNVSSEVVNERERIVAKYVVHKYVYVYVQNKLTESDSEAYISSSLNLLDTELSPN